MGFPSECINSRADQDVDEFITPKEILSIILHDALQQLEPAVRESFGAPGESKIGTSYPADFPTDWTVLFVEGINDGGIHPDNIVKKLPEPCSAVLGMLELLQMYNMFDEDVPRYVVLADAGGATFDVR